MIKRRTIIAWNNAGRPEFAEEGTTFENISTGELFTFKEGKWVSNNPVAPIETEPTPVVEKPKRKRATKQ